MKKMGRSHQPHLGFPNQSIMPTAKFQNTVFSLLCIIQLSAHNQVTLIWLSEPKIAFTWFLNSGPNLTSCLHTREGHEITFGLTWPAIFPGLAFHWRARRPTGPHRLHNRSDCKRGAAQTSGELAAAEVCKTRNAKISFYTNAFV